MRLNVIGKRIKFLRFEKSLTQKELGQILGTDQTTITKWENGIIEPNCDAIVCIASFFQVSTDYLLGLENEDGSKNIHSIIVRSEKQ